MRGYLSNWDNHHIRQHRGTNLMMIMNLGQHLFCFRYPRNRGTWLFSTLRGSKATGNRRGYPKGECVQQSRG